MKTDKSRGQGRHDAGKLANEIDIMKSIASVTHGTNAIVTIVETATVTVNDVAETVSDATETANATLDTATGAAGPAKAVTGTIGTASTAKR